MSVNNKYCLPIIETNIDTAIELIQINESKYKFFELWLDYFKNDYDEQLELLAQTYPERLLLLFRRQNLEEIQTSLEVRKQIIKKSKEGGFFIDCDIEIQKEELEYINQLEEPPKLICSYHNYHSTPDRAALDIVVGQMELYQPHIYKLACYCKSVQDALLLMQFGENLVSAGKPCIVLGMGEYGVLTRVFANMYWNQLIFVPTDREKASAPGQLSYAEYEQISQILQTAGVRNVG